MSSRRDTAGVAHTKWVDDLAQTRSHLREALVELRRRTDRNDHAVLDHQPGARAASKAHALVLDFRDLVEPWREDLADTWESVSLGEVTVYETLPAAKRRYNASGDARVAGSRVDTKIATRRGEITGLGVLDEFENSHVIHFEKVAGGIGSSMYEPTRSRQYVPPTVAINAYRELNRALADLDLAADVKAVETLNEDPF